MNKKATAIGLGNTNPPAAPLATPPEAPARSASPRAGVDGIWAPRSRVTAYDAAYVVLEPQLGAALVTRDARLARATGLGIEIISP